MSDAPTLEQHPEFDFIQWNPDNPKMINVSHPLLEGQLVIAEPTRGTLRAFQRRVSFEQGMTPTDDLVRSAKEASYLFFGFETIKGKKPEESGVDFDAMVGQDANRLCRGLAEVVQAYWSFR